MNGPPGRRDARTPGRRGVLLALLAAGCATPPGWQVTRWYPEVKRLEGIRFTDRDGIYGPRGNEVAIAGVVTGRADHTGHLLVILSGKERPDAVLAFAAEANLEKFYQYVTGRPLERYEDPFDGDFHGFFICR